MAVHPDLPGIIVTVCSSGKALKEHDAQNDRVENEEESVRLHLQKVTTTKYIESVTGQAFTVKLAVRRPYEMDSPKLSFHVYVDGQLVKKPLLSAAEYATKLWTGEVVGPEDRDFDSSTTAKIMIFGEIKSKSDPLPLESITGEKKKATHLGEIVVKVYRVSQGKLVKNISKKDSGFCTDRATDKYHEKALVLDAKSHTALLGNAKPVEAQAFWKTEKLDGEDYPLAIFKLRYRSRDSIKKLHILPASLQVNQEPTPRSQLPPEEELESESEPEDPLDPTNLSKLTEEQKKELQSFMRRLQAGVKKENATENRIKKEGGIGGPRKRSRPSEFIETIDLTEDVMKITKKRRRTAGSKANAEAVNLDDD